MNDKRVHKSSPLFCRGISFFLPVLFLLFLSSSFVFAVDKKPDKAEPTVITSETLVTNNKDKTAIFEGQVRARRGDVTLFADKMSVLYEGEDNTNKIKNILAEGNVKLVRGSYVITARTAEFIVAEEDKVIFSGEPRASDGENVVTGTRMTYYVKDDRAVVDQSKAFLVDKKKR